MTRAASRAAALAVVGALGLGLVALHGPAAAQPGSDVWGDSGSAGSAPGGSADPAPAPVPSPGSGSAVPAPLDPVPAPGSAGSGGAGSGSAVDPAPAPGPGSGSAGSGSAGSGSAAGSAAGSGAAGSGAPPIIIQVPTDANAPQVTAAASPTVVQLGGKFTLFVEATFAPGVEVNLREPLDLGPAFEVTRRLSEDKPTADGRITREWQIEVIAWELGDLMIPTIAVTYTAFGKADQVGTNAVKLRVEGVLGDVVDDPKAMRSNADPRDLLVRDWFWLYVAVGGVVGLIVLGVTWRLLRRRKREVVLVGGTLVARPRKLDTPGARALERLLAIEASGVLDRDDDRKDGYAQMVDVIREYLGARYRVATLDLTTSELMRQLAKVSAPADECRVIERWLESCDIVKYGGFKATATDARRTLDEARQLVTATTQGASTPAPAEPPAEAAA